MKNGRNWFDPRVGKRPARLVGRDDVLRDIEAAFEDGDEDDRVMIITGIKGSGKTVILAEAREMIQRNENNTSLRATEESAAIHRPEVLIIDDAAKDVPGLKEQLIEYGSLAQRGEAPMMLIAGQTHAVEELLKDEDLAYLKQARRLTLGNVRGDEVFALYKRAFEETYAGDTARGGKDSALKALRRAAEATEGHPYLIQLVGYYLSKEEKGIDDKAVDKAVFLAKIELYKNVHEPLFWGLSSKDRVFLWAMAQDEAVSEFGEIARRMGVSTGYASKYRERLLGAGLIYRSAYGELAFTLPYMKEYIEKEYIERLGGEGGKRRL